MYGFFLNNSALHPALPSARKDLDNCVTAHPPSFSLVPQLRKTIPVTKSPAHSNTMVNLFPPWSLSSPSPKTSSFSCGTVVRHMVFGYHCGGLLNRSPRASSPLGSPSFRNTFPNPLFFATGVFSLLFFFCLQIQISRSSSPPREPISETPRTTR